MWEKCSKLLFSVLLLVLMFSGCGEQELEVEKYKVAKIEGRTNTESADLLCGLMAQYHDAELGETTSAGKKHLIYAVSNEEFAKELGYSLDAMAENSFVILNKEDSVYILAQDAEGLNRASSYFVKYLVSEDGEMLLKNGEDHIEMGTAVKKAVTVGGTPMGEYVIAYSDQDAMEACEELQYYIHQTGGDFLDIVSKREAGASAIYLSLNKKLGTGNKSFEITDGQIHIAAADEETLLEGVYLFLDTYLGWMQAGSENARISNVASVINVPANVKTQTAWMEEREAAIVLWNVNYTRGVYLNSNTSLKNNIMDYSEEQLYEYVKMLKYCGYTGIQLTDMCAAWAGVGSYEIVHDKMRTLADAAHSLDMKVTLWVWGGQFTAFGWVDETITYDYNGYGYQHENPDVVASCEKYYSIYAELADCCDRVIAHFYDPGSINTAEAIGYFSKMLKDKFQAVNPDIDFGVSCHVDVYDKQTIINAIGTDVTLYEKGHHDDVGEYNRFRSEVAALGCRLGTWAWNTCEMELDQLAQMNFNMDVIREVYHIARSYDGIMKPSYWCEMDCYHVLNVFSLYCAGQMLINPDIEAADLYEQISVAAVGEEYAADFAEILSIIQDARTGHTWSEYWWNSPNYVLKSENYQAEQIYQRCEKYMPILQEMIDREIETNTLPLPISLNDVLRLIQPHLRQIQDFAAFRMALAQLKADYAAGTSVAIIEERLEKIAVPIKDYNCVIGLWGQVEARAQLEMITEFCNTIGIRVPNNKAFDEQRKRYILAEITTYQKEQIRVPYESFPDYYQWGVAYGAEETARLVEEMVQDGVLIRNENGSVTLADWENYIYHFD